MFGSRQGAPAQGDAHAVFGLGHGGAPRGGGGLRLHRAGVIVANLLGEPCAVWSPQRPSVPALASLCLPGGSSVKPWLLRVRPGCV